MILANESVAGLLAGRTPRALYRVHERPEPLSVELCSRSSPRSRCRRRPRPTPTAWRRTRRRRSPPRPASASPSTSRGRTRQGGVPDARPAGAEAGALRPAEPRPLGSREHRLLPLHVADPPLPRPGRAPRAAPRARRDRRAAPEDLAASAEHCSVREREAAGIEYLGDELCLPGCWRPCCSSAAGRSRSTARSWADPRRPVRPLRRGLRRPAAGAPPRRRLLRARPARDALVGRRGGRSSGSATRSRSASRTSAARG